MGAAQSGADGGAGAEQVPQQERAEVAAPEKEGSVRSGSQASRGSKTKKRRRKRRKAENVQPSRSCATLLSVTQPGAVPAAPDASVGSDDASSQVSGAMSAGGANGHPPNAEIAKRLSASTAASGGEGVAGHADAAEKSKSAASSDAGAAAANRGHEAAPSVGRPASEELSELRSVASAAKKPEPAREEELKKDVMRLLRQRLHRGVRDPNLEAELASEIQSSQAGDDDGGSEAGSVVDPAQSQRQQSSRKSKKDTVEAEQMREFEPAYRIKMGQKKGPAAVLSRGLVGYYVRRPKLDINKARAAQARLQHAAMKMGKRSETFSRTGTDRSQMVLNAFVEADRAFNELFREDSSGSGEWDSFSDLDDDDDDEVPAAAGDEAARGAGGLSRVDTLMALRHQAADARKRGNLVEFRRIKERERQERERLQRRRSLREEKERFEREFNEAFERGKSEELFPPNTMIVPVPHITKFEQAQKNWLKPRPKPPEVKPSRRRPMMPPDSMKLVVTLHGTYQHSFMFFELGTALVQRGYTVLSFDFYGRGETPWPDVDSQYISSDVDVLVEQTADMLSYLGLLNTTGDDTLPSHAEFNVLKPVLTFTLLGYDIGAAVAAGLAARYPKEVEALILLSPVGFSSSGTLQNFLLPALSCDCCRREHQILERHTQEFFNSERSEKLVRREQEEILEQMSYTAGYIKSVMSTWKGFPVRAMSHVYTTAGLDSRPVLVMWGTQDRVTPFDVEVEAAVASMLPRARVVFVDEAGHHVLAEDFHRVTHEIVSFLHRHCPLPPNLLPALPSSQVQPDMVRKAGRRFEEDQSRYDDLFSLVTVPEHEELEVGADHAPGGMDKKQAEEEDRRSIATTASSDASLNRIDASRRVLTHHSLEQRDQHAEPGSAAPAPAPAAEGDDSESVATDVAEMLVRIEAKDDARQMQRELQRLRSEKEERRRRRKEKRRQQRREQRLRKQAEKKGVQQRDSAGQGMEESREPSQHSRSAHAGARKHRSDVTLASAAAEAGAKIKDEPAEADIRWARKQMQREEWAKSKGEVLDYNVYDDEDDEDEEEDEKEKPKDKDKEEKQGSDTGAQQPKQQREEKVTDRPPDRNRSWWDWRNVYNNFEMK